MDLTRKDFARPGALLLCLAFSSWLPLACKHGSETRSANPPEAAASATAYDTLAGKIKVGESFISIVRNLGLDEKESSLLLSSIKENFRFKLFAGQVYRVVVRRADSAARLASFALEDRYADHKHVLFRSEASAPGFKVFSLDYRVEDIPVRVDTEAVSGTLTSNLYDAFMARGETPGLIQQVTKIFAWDVDFFKDPRVGDEFSLLVEKKYGEDGSFRGYGEVLSAKYVNRGHDFYGILYKGAYYDQSGRSLEKMLLKAPLPFAKVSSGFSGARLHPILGVKRPHWGIDYVAPRGTTIWAAGDGTVEYAKWVNGYGKTVKIHHNGVYNTYYAHLQGFAAGMYSGRRVKQGETIGFLGMTGMATGPHLDYRVELNGKYINPGSLKTESKQGVPNQEFQAFSDQRDLLLARMYAPDIKRFAGPVEHPSAPSAAHPARTPG
jgi:murein DD-endopeptidase MepM/ murein hydrolase activator NlpD